MIAGADTSRGASTTASQTRRTFLQRLGLGSLTLSAMSVAGTATTALAAASPSSADAAPKRRRGIRVFRFRTRNTVSCRACQMHHRYKIFRTRRIAKGHRAHPGCDCPIVGQWIAPRTYRRLFKPAGAVKRGVVDLRAI